MTELKPCPFCGDTPRSTKLRINCSCGASHNPSDWNTRSAPELPEGYEVIGTHLICKRLPHDLSLIAFIRAGELVCSNVESEHWQAVAAFVQGAR